MDDLAAGFFGKNFCEKNCDFAYPYILLIQVVFIVLDLFKEWFVDGLPLMTYGLKLSIEEWIF